MYHKTIETKEDAIRFIRKGNTVDILDRLERLVKMIGDEEKQPVES